MYNYSTYCTNRILTRSVHQVRVYAFSASTTVYKALTNQGEVHQYIDHIICFNTKDSHHLNKHIILQVFHARGYNSLMLLS